MTIVFSSLYESQCIAYCNARPRQNLIIEKDFFSGLFNVLDAG